MKGTLAPGQIVRVGEQAVRIERYLSEGGYAHVYLTSSDKPIYPPTKEEKKGRWGEKGYTQHCLKRIAFQDEAVWADVKKEIAVMVSIFRPSTAADLQKALPSNPHLTQYLGSAHSKLPGGGYEVYILMEFCSGECISPFIADVQAEVSSTCSTNVSGIGFQKPKSLTSSPTSAR